jgi:hypothetical protein
VTGAISCLFTEIETRSQPLPGQLVTFRRRTWLAKYFLEPVQHSYSRMLGLRLTRRSKTIVASFMLHNLLVKFNIVGDFLFEQQSPRYFLQVGDQEMRLKIPMALGCKSPLVDPVEKSSLPSCTADHQVA